MPKPSSHLYSVHPGIADMQDWLDQLPAKTGRSLEQWLKFIKKEGPADEESRCAWLKDKHKLGANTAWWLAEKASNAGKLAEDTPEGYLKLAPRYVEEQYAGKKAGLRPIYEELLSLGLGIARPDWRRTLRRVVIWGQSRGRVGAEPMCMLLVHDDHLTPPALRRIDCGVVVPAFTRPEGDIGVRIIGGRYYGVTTSLGPPAATSAVERWIRQIAARDYSPAAPAGTGNIRIHIPLDCPWRSGTPGFDVLVPLEHPPQSHRLYFVRQRWEWNSQNTDGD